MGRKPKETGVKKVRLPTKTVRLYNKSLKDVLMYLCDENFVEAQSITRIDKKFNARFILLKKIKSF